ncbi:MAG TPA: oligosaccharide flippase family protein [Leptospiraceae bacterium]|nr:oligosaccharide flippase family protein [Leptospiraceae bacterium]
MGELRNKLNSRFGKGVFLFVSRAFNSLAGLFFSLLAGRFLTVEDHGLFASVVARMVIAQAILEAGLQYSIVRFLAPAIRSGAEGEVQSIIRASLWIKTIAMVGLGSLIAIACVILSFWSGPQGVREILPDFGSPLMLWMIFVGGTSMSFVSYQEAILVSHGAYNRLSAWIPLTGVLRIALFGGLFLFERGFGPEEIVFAYTFGPVISSVLFFFVFPAKFFFDLSQGTEWRSRLRALVSYNAFIVAASFFSIFSDWMEVLMLQESRDTGVYNAARMPLQGFMILLATMQSMFLPWFAGLKNASEYRAVFLRVYRYLIPGAILLAPGLAVLAWFIPFWFGPEYVASVHVLYFLYPGYLLKLLFAPLGTALFALDRPRLVAVEAGARMAAGFLLNSFLIPGLGIMGAAVSGFLSPFAGWFFLIFCYARFFKTGEFPFPEKTRAD